MPVVIIDGPEAAGKSTIIDALMAEWGVPHKYRGMGPKESWLEYCQPLWDDIKECQYDPTKLIVWSRGWASRTVYNELLQQGQSVPREVTRELGMIVARSGGFLGMVSSPITVLQERRLARVAAGDFRDHQLDTAKELAAFQRYAKVGGPWHTLDGTALPEDNVRKIMNILVMRNPNCRMKTEEVLLTE